MGLTKKEILERLKKDGVDMGRNPNRTFVYLRSEGLLERVGTKRKIALYHESSVDVIKQLRIEQNNGGTIETFREKLSHEKTKNDYICRKLGIKNEGQRFYTACVDAEFELILKEEGGRCYSNRKEGERFDFIIAYYKDRVVYFRIANKKQNDFSILFKKELSHEEYGAIADTVAIKAAKEVHPHPPTSWEIHFAVLGLEIEECDNRLLLIGSQN